MECQEFYSLFFGMFYLLDTCGHLFFRTAVDNHGTFGTQTLGGTNRIHSCVSSTDNRYILAESYRSVGFFTGCVHQIDTGEIFVGRHDVDRVLSGNIHKVRQSRTGSDKYAFETFCLQILHADCFSYDAVFDKVNPHLHKVVYFYIYNLVGQTEFGNTVFQYTTNFM